MEKQNKKNLINNLDEFEILNPNALEEILGGASCKQKYSTTTKQQMTMDDGGTTTSCGCGYKS